MPTPPTQTDFSTLGLAPPLLTALQQLAHLTPTPIQTHAIPLIIAGHDVQAKADTGSGKTAAFGLALLQKLIHQRASGTHPKSAGNPVKSLIIVPTRELCLQVTGALNDYASAIQPRIKIYGAIGGVNITPQMLALRGGADILIATPGRLLDLQQHNAINLDHMHTLVLDEADQLLQQGFSEELQQILQIVPKHRQNLLFSATFPPDLQALITTVLKTPHNLDCSPVKTSTLIEQRVICIPAERKNALLAHLIQHNETPQILVFANAKNTCNRLVLKLAKAGIHALALHSDKSQAARQQALDSFKRQQCPVLIATDVAARGIDIVDLATVINFDLPRSPNDYIHRIGRTGRNGQSGQAISLICDSDEAHCRLIEKRIKMRIPREQGEELMLRQT